METQPQDDGYWVTVFGFPKWLKRKALDKMRQYGKITGHEVPPRRNCNWFYVRYSCTHDAERAAKNQNAGSLTSTVMIGVKLHRVRGSGHFSEDQEDCKPFPCQLLPRTQQLCNTPDTQDHSLTNSLNNFQIKQELQSDNDEDNTAHRNFCPGSPATKQHFKTEKSEELPFIKSVESLSEVSAKQKQDDGLSQPKGLPTPSPQHFCHQVTSVETVDNRSGTIIETEEEEDDYYFSECSTDETESKVSPLTPDKEDDEELSFTTSLHGEHKTEEKAEKERKSEEKAEKEGKGDETVLLPAVSVSRNSVTSACETSPENDGLQANAETQVRCSINSDSSACRNAQENDGLEVNAETQDTHSNETCDVEAEGGNADLQQFECDALLDSERWYSVTFSGSKKKFSCTLCGKRMSAKSIVKSHVRYVHHGERKYSCSICGKLWECHSSLNRHMSTVHNPEIVPCHICKKMYNKAYLDKHIANMHCKRRKRKDKVCETCGANFSTAVNLNIHMRLTHLEEKSFLCNICGRCFGERGTLKKHMSGVHDNLRPHVCHICGDTFTQKSNLNHHIQSGHNKERRFKCVHCEKKYSQKFKLKKHLAKVHNVVQLTETSNEKKQHVE